MAYGEELSRLSPCGDELITECVNKFCPGAGKLVDVGCGRGERLAALGRAFPELELWGADIDGDMLALAGENTAAQLLCCDASAIPAPEGSFDAALCECSLSLFPESEKSLGEMHRLLRKGGVLILGDIYGRLAADGGDSGRGLIGAVRSLAEIEAMAERAGFTLLCYEDRSADLTAMAAQMIFDGSLCGCMDTETLLLLRRVKAGYGLWVYKKEEKLYGE